MTNNCPTFLSRYLRDGSVSLQCRQTGTRYLIAVCDFPQRDDCAAYREGQMIRTGPRASCVDAVESDAKWNIRLMQQPNGDGFDALYEEAHNRGRC